MYKLPPFIINFHGIGKLRRHFELGEEPYWLDRASFEKILDFLGQYQLGSGVRLTFDDGNISDYEVAAPELQRRRLHAGFFVLAGKLGSKGYLSKLMLRDLAIQGFEIGSHGMDHIFWTQANTASLAREIRDSKAILEDTTGGPIRSVAVPFGRYNGRVLGELRTCGYENIYTSDGGPRLTKLSPTPRYSFKQHVDLSSLGRILKKCDRIYNRLANETRLLVKAVPFNRPMSSSDSVQPSKT